MAKGYLAFVLHAHLPFVRHPEYDAFLEERWFFEAVTETYIPLIKFFRQAADEGVPFQLTFSISPCLLAMMEDVLLRKKYAEHLDRVIRLAEEEVRRTTNAPHFNWLARMYRDLFLETRDIFRGCDGRIVNLFMDLHQRGVLKLITSSATHGILPMLMAQPKCVDAQVRVGLDYFESVFGFRPRGMWLPECAYTPGLDRILADNGVGYFFLESHGIDHAGVMPLYSVYAPVFTPHGVAAFGRDRGSTKEVWDANTGFPGDVDYREFYRDIGHDLDDDYIREYLGGEVASDTGIKYFRITAHGGGHKEPYNPDVAREKASAHAADFLYKRMGHVDYLYGATGQPPIIVAPFDAELFGHWWFEGPQWLNFLIRKAAFDQDTVELTSISRYLDRHPVHQRSEPATSTWGHEGNFVTWINGKVDWIYDHLIECGRRMHELARRHNNGSVKAQTRRALNQCVRELLLAQCSDWPFIISNQTSTGYAERRVKDHIGRFHYLADAIEKDDIDEKYLRAIEYLDQIFPDVDYHLYCDADAEAASVIAQAEVCSPGA